MVLFGSGLVRVVGSVLVCELGIIVVWVVGIILDCVVCIVLVRVVGNILVCVLGIVLVGIILVGVVGIILVGITSLRGAAVLATVTSTGFDPVSLLSVKSGSSQRCQFSPLFATNSSLLAKYSRGGFESSHPCIWNWMGPLDMIGVIWSPPTLASRELHPMSVLPAMS